MAPAKHEGCSGTRNLKDNISDLKAQIAANNKVRERRGAYTSFKKYWHQNKYCTLLNLKRIIS